MFTIAYSNVFQKLLNSLTVSGHELVFFSALSNFYVNCRKNTVQAVGLHTSTDQNLSFTFLHTSTDQNLSFTFLPTSTDQNLSFTFLHTSTDHNLSFTFLHTGTGRERRICLYFFFLILFFSSLSACS